ncbi:MAG: sulfatase-like hydrolase/transferase [Opitutales bacterium]|jgi:choline-sulfatase|nr:sulfatase-like hydrolase/transferase [Opitutales bacterium]MBT5813713.1 sulfatase-like hydrolase/transferase [Opitutales bacterium]MBT6378850.1 sulfatase-like hydrolase/transferase [Opitutales bacterium]MBT6769563.1 sulfatase-like hydrolase/transferase [Opitutales bacterium]MDG2253696.1 sulfatase-like hydrolase/transferase [Opitutaceae bacterium]
MPIKQLRISIAASISLLGTLVAVFASPLNAEDQKRPNILFIIADDQSPFDLKIYDPKSPLDTPRIDQLAREGMILDGAYHMGAWLSGVCVPSRHMIMSGRTLWHAPNRPGRTDNPHANDPSKVPTDIVQNTLPAVFNRAGYDTMRTCKRGNSFEAANVLFADRRDADKRGGTHESGSGWHGDRVLEYLDERESSQDTDPFLIYFGFSHPHDTRDGKSELLTKYGAVNHTDPNTLPLVNSKQPKLPPNYLTGHPFPFRLPGARDEERVSGVWKNRDEATIRNELGREFACSENIDIQVGRVLDKLDAMGELENTYVIYTSDHGIAIGRHGLQGKQNLYEHSWRVPFIVRGPGIEPGTRATGNLYLLDILATLCDFAQIPAPKTNEGISLKPVFEGNTDAVREVLYGVFCAETRPGLRCIKKGDWKLIKYDVMDGQYRKTQLFNLADNPHELIFQHHDPIVTRLTGLSPKPNQTNLADNPIYADKLEEMEELLLSEMRQHDDPFRLWNQPKD